MTIITKTSPKGIATTVSDNSPSNSAPSNNGSNSGGSSGLKDLSNISQFITPGKEAEAEALSNKYGYTLKSPITDSSQTRANDAKLGQNIKNAKGLVVPGSSDGEMLDVTNSDYLKYINDYIKGLSRRYELERNSISADYEEQKKNLEKTQAREAGSTQAGILRMGGYLGESGSGTGVLLTQAEQHKNELLSLQGKKDKALLEAQNAYEDKNFEAANKAYTIAMDIEDKMYNRQQDFFKNQMTLDKFNADKAERDLTALSFIDKENLNTPEVLAKINEIDDYYGSPGFSVKYIAAAKKEQEAKEAKDQLAIDKAYMDILTDIPYGKTVVLPNGKAYTGLKVSATSSSGPNVPITSDKAIQLGLPLDVVGMTEKDLIFSMELQNPPLWFAKKRANEISESKGPDYSTIQLNDLIRKDWEAFRNQPDVTAFRNTLRLDYRSGLPSGNSDGLSPEELSALGA